MCLHQWQYNTLRKKILQEIQEFLQEMGDTEEMLQRLDFI